MKNRLCAIALSGLLAMACLPAQAVPLAADGVFQEFQFGLPGSPFSTEPDGLPISFDFVLLAQGLLRITDAGLSGDRFQVIINGGAPQLTSLPGNGGDQGLDFELAFADPLFSTASFFLPAGNFSVTGFVIDSPFDAGIGGISLLQVDEPPSAALLLLGLGLAGGISRFRRSSSRTKDLT